MFNLLIHTASAAIKTVTLPIDIVADALTGAPVVNNPNDPCFTERKLKSIQRDLKNASK